MNNLKEAKGSTAFLTPVLLSQRVGDRIILENYTVTSADMDTIVGSGGINPKILSSAIAF